MAYRLLKDKSNAIWQFVRDLNSLEIKHEDFLQQKKLD